MTNLVYCKLKKGHINFFVTWEKQGQVFRRRQNETHF